MGDAKIGTAVSYKNVDTQWVGEFFHNLTFADTASTQTIFSKMGEEHLITLGCGAKAV